MIIPAAAHPNYAERSTFSCPDAKCGRNIHIVTASMFYTPLLIVGARRVSSCCIAGLLRRGRRRGLSLSFKFARMRAQSAQSVPKTSWFRVSMLIISTPS